MHDEHMKELLKLILDKLKEDDSPIETVPAPLTEEDLVTDLKVFAEEFYEGRVRERSADSIVLDFDNGQTFRIDVREIGHGVLN